ncbi:AAC(3) family N-acetyltransferase [Phycisphaerales bacterium AB-hyl4]|uniref:Aminoglycoside N(3)-acetyltransferase n=1 Tax=Natronomicrosphaera hydrolytica TaxID=3242702 RepID=A0ABV4U3U0_9BACT
MDTVSQLTLAGQLRNLGVQPGGVLLVHTAYSKIKPVEDGPKGLIAALRKSVGPTGTLVMPSMSFDDEHPFDITATPCPEMGVVADMFWRQPGVLRSDSPHAFAAVGRHADVITADHPIDPPHGMNSPVGRAYERDAQVLLLGIDHTANTTIHLAEELAGVRYRRDQRITILRDGEPEIFEYREIDHCCENFAFVDRWLDERSLQRRGVVGHGEVRLVRSQDIVDVVTYHLRDNETTFLHPKGVCEECDDAWRSLSNDAPQ